MDAETRPVTAHSSEGGRRSVTSAVPPRRAPSRPAAYPPFAKSSGPRYLRAIVTVSAIDHLD